MNASIKTTMTIIAAMMLLSACETMQGLGRDTHKLGNDVTGAAEKHDLDNDPNK